MQSFLTVLNTSLGQHVRMQGDLVCAERLVPMPVPVDRDAGYEVSAVTIVTGGTKGLGMEYIKEVMSVQSSSPKQTTNHSGNGNIMEVFCYGLDGPAGFESSACVLRSDDVSPRHSPKRIAPGFCAIRRMLLHCPM